VALRRGAPEKLARMTEMAAGATAAADTLALAKPAGLKFTSTVGNAVGVNEAEMTAPHPKGASALAGCTTHETNPSMG